MFAKRGSGIRQGWWFRGFVLRSDNGSKGFINPERRWKYLRGRNGCKSAILGRGNGRSILGRWRASRLLVEIGRFKSLRNLGLFGVACAKKGKASKVGFGSNS